MKTLLQILKEIAMNVVVAVISVFMIVILINLFAEIARADTNTYKTLIAHEAMNQGLEPAVALAVAEVESTFNPKATGKQGEVGLFQLHPRYHKSPSYDVNKNIRDGVSTLLFWQKNCNTKTKLTWIQCFNTGNRKLRSPQTAPYYKKVMRRYNRYKTLPVIPPQQDDPVTKVSGSTPEA